MAEGFTGFPREATEFFRELALNNNRDWFQGHKDVYEQACREPLKALVTELDPVGTPHISRINRDMRFSRDGAPSRHTSPLASWEPTSICQQRVCTSAPACTARSRPCFRSFAAAIDRTSRTRARTGS